MRLHYLLDDSVVAMGEMCGDVIGLNDSVYLGQYGLHFRHIGSFCIDLIYALCLRIPVCQLLVAIYAPGDRIILSAVTHPARHNCATDTPVELEGYPPP